MINIFFIGHIFSKLQMYTVNWLTIFLILNLITNKLLKTKKKSITVDILVIKASKMLHINYRLINCNLLKLTNL